MNPEALFLQVLQQGLALTAKLLAPMLLISSAVGIMVGLFQTVTQINEMTLTFIPKIIVVGLVLLILGPWMMHLLMDFSHDLILGIPAAVKF
ncbi:EscS/YscS/HrcS family type III secretion system export apparatus protein [bacterium (Candidatus Blackallbacteria) CG17_big_fil_post_rev_8_21_14_2_50_48_46]|uniref:EscS/YscS/HrcS family type III secretion system export apparatus protein n=1 Tax=bacterium (Candidatus Blackallbacteria) CG17_big_fil_post_rev_8_21_14_2_50_48_46 TaxID=2014261 RepID=A0A2M7GAK5_9BACT|nr:MAG: EscS/YscS/HrcS family type III secretion system export apparatus protein [bacterium (Candidatus Blackallbacteria) CG18_big_fil_WC_8_21_14_2_50_49_26]PIW18957.1 MAG: EscS/YscS/HrcS family type III secretion system export apparatus protein [bacterium (Candidatus Blackallbacteria) CG17_big_fil_post_rev_8_21_14_2_50_48_46]PIW44675.1 MAG: EscS/YscS/HrcS family type III secretion system export apparatus protein [bacterium (Candidatus Blackallbacteria) CG13_big_fil_rev_8_21_14_2_50_49_14]